MGEYTLTYRDKNKVIHTKLFRGDISDILEQAIETPGDYTDAVGEVDYRKYRDKLEQKHEDDKGKGKQ